MLFLCYKGQEDCVVHFHSCRFTVGVSWLFGSFIYLTLQMESSFQGHRDQTDDASTLSPVCLLFNQAQTLTETLRVLRAVPNGAVRSGWGSNANVG